ncbi:MAG: PadR family transcriptional regulator [Solirubrobacterales bacterium]|nr:PadR family transcriptional regulator [Solirubrobacterales bacterium]
MGLMIERPTYGYRIQAQAAELLTSLGVSDGATYKVLERLEDEGWIEVVEEREGTSPRGPRRVFFRATPEGVEQFERWISSPTAEPTIRDELLAKIAVSRPQDRQEILRAAELQLEAAWSQLAAMRQPSPTTIEQALDRPWGATAEGMLLDLRARTLRARIDWLDYVCELLDGLLPATERTGG